MASEIDLARIASRTVGFAIIGALPSAQLVAMSERALSEAPELVDADTGQVRQVLGSLAMGVLPSQEACIAARGEIEALRASYSPRQQHAPELGAAGPRG